MQIFIVCTIRDMSSARNRGFTGDSRPQSHVERTVVIAARLSFTAEFEEVSQNKVVARDDRDVRNHCVSSVDECSRNDDMEGVP
jgi:hypothetical protein